MSLIRSIQACTQCNSSMLVLRKRGIDDDGGGSGGARRISMEALIMTGKGRNIRRRGPLRRL